MPLLMCPNCQEGMREISRNGVLIDVCPKCRGVWLDRGELEKLMTAVREVEASYGGEPPRPAPGPTAVPPPPPDPYGHYYRKKKKRKSVFDLFEDLFD